MRKYQLLLFFFILLAGTTEAQYSRYIIELKDKKGTIFSISNPSAFLSQKAVERRTRQKIAIDSTDLPVSYAYVQSIASVPNVKVISISKWLNQVAIETTDAAALAQVSSFPFVKQSLPLAATNKSSGKKTKSILSYGQDSSIETAASSEATQLNYGATYNQVHMHQGDYLHNLGFTGEGMTIAILDGGFYHYKSNPVFDSLILQNRILGEWDFVRDEQSVNEDDAHGMYCLSVLAANRPGYLVGSAPRAKYYLFRTEDVGSEYPIEEQFWAAGAERADSLGVDMISSSVGYADFDNAVFNYSLAERDGNTTIITRAADLAAKKGILVVNSAGNSGAAADDLRFISAPADADSIIAVGAVDISGSIAYFSSWGPNGSGKQKPDIVSLGINASISDANGNPATNNGTSFATPNLAGLIACLWQAYPEFNNMEIIDVVKRSGNRFDNPDNRYGSGIPDFKKATQLLTQSRVLRNQSSLNNNNWVKVFPIPYQPATSVLFRAPSTAKASLRLLDASGKIIETQSMDVIANSFYSMQFNSLPYVAKGIYLVQYHDGVNKKTIPIIK